MRPVPKPPADLARRSLPDLDLAAPPAQLGEQLRSLTFPGDQLGCYETFAVRVDATAWPAQQVEQLFAELAYPYDEDCRRAGEDGSGFSWQAAGSVTVDVAWHWDGDGLLLFRLRRGEQVLRVVENDDCKKFGRWKDRPWPQMSIAALTAFARELLDAQPNLRAIHLEPAEVDALRISAVDATALTEAQAAAWRGWLEQVVAWPWGMRLVRVDRAGLHVL